jgi:hypothetical protein
MPAYNVRFGATAAVTPQKMTCEHERKQPAERTVKAAAAPSRRSLSASGGQRSGNERETKTLEARNRQRVRN